VIGYMGGFQDYQGLADLLRAAKLLVERGHQFRLLLVGSGPMAGSLADQIEELALGHCTWLRGRVPHDDVPRYYSLIDIAPFPRPPNPVCDIVSPIKPLEAMAMEKAVVVSSVAALSEMVEDEQTGLVFEKGSVPALADALERLLLDEALRRRLGKAARVWVRENRSWQRAARAIAACYESLGVRAVGR
jgi:glycosyltransferase involved in cell wall biosynthesis